MLIHDSSKTQRLRRTLGAVCRGVARRFDRPGGRTVLCNAWNCSQRWRGFQNEAHFDGRWFYRADTDWIAGEPHFEFRSQQQVAEQLAACLADAREYWFHRYQPQPGDVIVDIGAGRGEDTYAFSKAVGPTGRVIAIEAHPGSYSALKTLCDINRLDNVELVFAAVMDKPGYATALEGDSWACNTVAHCTAETKSNVMATTFDAICSSLNLGTINFLKMNIEGAETPALRGMPNSLPRIESICVACHDFLATGSHQQHYRTRRFVESALVDSGFSLTLRYSDPRDYVRDHVHGTRA